MRSSFDAADSGLAALFDAGRSAWPGVEVSEAAFGAYLAALAVAPDAGPPPLSLAGDLYIAGACSAGAAGAVAAFERGFSDVIARAVRRIDPSAAFADDIRQAVCERLFVASDGAPAKITEYAGRAPLRAWVRAVAIRIALNHRRSKAAQPHEPLEDERLPRAISDPEIDLLKAKYKAEFEAAARVAVARLSRKDRGILRLHLIDGLSIDVLGAHYSVGRSTAARWLASARESLRELTRAEIEARLRLTSSELASVAALVRSQVEVSARGLLDGDEA